MLSRVTAKNVGDVFLRNTVVRKLKSASVRVYRECEIVDRLAVIMPNTFHFHMNWHDSILK